MPSGGVALSMSVPGAGGPFNPLSLPGLSYLIQTDNNAVFNGGGFCTSIGSLTPGNPTFTQTTADANRFIRDTATIPGHTVLQRTDSGSPRYMTRSDAPMFGPYSGYNAQYAFGFYAKGDSVNFPGAFAGMLINDGGSTNQLQISSLTSATSLRTSRVGTGTGGGAASGSTVFDFTQAKTATAFHLISCEFDGSLNEMSMFYDGVLVAVISGSAVRDPINMTVGRLGTTQAPAAPCAGRFGGWFACSQKIGATNHLNLYNWYVASFV